MNIEQLRLTNLYKNLHWIDGKPIQGESEFPEDEPMVCQTKDGKIFVVGNCNFQGGGCGCCNLHSIDQVVLHAYLFK